jgi:hypothetical protein
MDIFGKVTSEMVLDNVGYKNMPSYHEFNPEWGVDVLKVGNSLGAGSIAFEYKDSLYRLGDNGIGSCRIFTEGPLRSLFRFEYKDWKMGDQILDVIHDISITAGKYYYNNTISYSGSDSLLNIVTGIVNKKSQMLYQTPADNKHQSFYTFDLQSEDTSLLGMGIQVSRDLISKVSTSPDSGEGIIETYCLHLHAKPEQPVSFKFYSVWEKEDAKWNSKEGFEKFLLEEERKVEKVLNVNIVRN